MTTSEAAESPEMDAPSTPTQDPTSVDVVVAGAGIAGLYLARLLVEGGLSVGVWEARDRPGGRLLTHPIPGGAVELGASWFWPDEPRIQALLTELGRSTHPQFLDGDAMYEDGNGVQRLQGNPIDVPSGRVSEGFQGVANTIAERLPEGSIHYRRSLESIECLEDRVLAVGGGTTVAARHVALAMPPALAAHDITFAPPLRPPMAELAASTPVWMGAMTKVVAKYPEPFWRSRGLSGAAISHVGPMREVHDMSGPGGAPALLFGFVPPADAGGATVTEAQIRSQFLRIFGPQGDPEELHLMDWRRERYTSPPGVERLQNYGTYGHRAFAEPTSGGRVHWTSTETSSRFPGHIEGALEAAERTAGAILDHASSA